MKKSSITHAITLLILLFLASVSLGQTEMAPVPAISLGQRFEITEKHPLWNSLIEVSKESHNVGQTILNNGGDPTNYISCNETVCCKTVHYYSFSFGCWYFLTTCWAVSDQRKLLDVVQVH